MNYRLSKATAGLATLGAALALSLSLAGAGASALTGYHYDDDVRPRPRISVNLGGGCTGGGLNLPGAWKDRVDGTAVNGPCKVSHYNNTNYNSFLINTYHPSSPSISFFPNQFFYNKAESIKYRPGIQ